MVNMESSHKTCDDLGMLYGIRFTTLIFTYLSNIYFGGWLIINDVQKNVPYLKINQLINN